MRSEHVHVTNIAGNYLRCSFERVHAYAKPALIGGWPCAAIAKPNQVSRSRFVISFAWTTVRRHSSCVC